MTIKQQSVAFGFAACPWHRCQSLLPPHPLVSLWNTQLGVALSLSLCVYLYAELVRSQGRQRRYLRAPRWPRGKRKVSLICNEQTDIDDCCRVQESLIKPLYCSREREEHFFRRFAAAVSYDFSTTSVPVLHHICWLPLLLCHLPRF